MPRVEFSEENVSKNDYNYPKFKLEKKGEKARVAILESPYAEYVHNIRKPKLVGGVPQKEWKTTKSGEKYEDYVYEFVSRPICLGDYGTLQSDGSDPDHCPVCAEAKRSDKFFGPQRRFALHLVKYDTVPGTTTVKEPFSAQTLIYSFTNKVYDELFALKGQGFDLVNHDLIFTSENPMFHGYGIQPSMEAEWQKSDERKKYIKALMSKENLAPDLAIFCGSKKSEKQLEYDIRAVNEAWEIATGVVSASAHDQALSSVGGSLDLSAGLADILGETTPNTDSDGWHKEPEAATSFEALGIGSDKPANGDSADDIEAMLRNL